ncbi:hypothetical protein DEU56DRAFT_905880 [Suillus clintonianus]|uniref:uncharacterized protein n=1 Tax=Suillus clintonianus TaxID=1904413 RepID=UPI001B871CF7|nr:uncharacterized protein DEU56DRAFT_905880 [Suillus clintonianus]KAG2157218.1 hypothetical protein DEU56DRAFT_905880 [Suillus clintonianus]
MPLQRTVPQDAAGETSRQVNNILRNLRGEHFRHSRNVQRVPASLPTPLHVNNLPTLPISLIYPSAEDGGRNAAAASGYHSTRPVWIAGPDPPRSWTALSSPKIREADLTDINSPAWREHALNLVFSPGNASAHPPGSQSLRALRKREFPTLALLSLHVIRTECSAYELADIMSHIPPHLRRVLMRHSAINSPFSRSELNAICGEEGHADGELVVVGPHATLRSDHFRRMHSSRESVPEECAADESTWDSLATLGSEPSVLFSVTFLSTPLTFSLSDLPPTITCLALINIPKPVSLQRLSLQRLPSYCPLVSLLDLSYNSWLIPALGERLLDDYPWTKLHYLKVLGLRGCRVTSTLLSQVNRGRWDDVDVIH